MTGPKHRCHAKDCESIVPPKLFMCKRHWFLLPSGYRNALWDQYVPGQEITKTPTDGYLAAAKACIDYVHNYEVQYEQIPDAPHD